MANLFKEIEITNFRGFDNLKIDNLSKLNVFIGANNVGKTSILESVFLITGMSNPIVQARINLLRSNNFANPDGTTLDGARYLFHNLNLSIAPTISARMNDGGIRKVSLSADLKNDTENLTASSNASNRASIKQMNFNFNDKDDQSSAYHSSIYSDANGELRQTIDSRYTETLNGLFILGDKNDGSASTHFSSLVKRGGKQLVIDVIKEFQDSIKTIEALPDGLYLQINGIQELLPISMSGDGIRRMINIISSILDVDYHIVMIDEIDNGLHYSAHKLIWRTILKFAQQRDIQLFVTTHNIDCLLGLKNAMEENPEFQALTNVYNIAKTKAKGFKSYRYSYNELKEAIEQEIEIRR